MSDLEERFWERAPRGSPDACWIWQGSHGSNGYGRLKHAGRELSAHRLAVELSGRSIPDGHFVCHACDTPLCVNPDHLFVGTPADNQRDAAEKFRMSQGERHHKAKLNPQKVRAIREAHANGSGIRPLSREYGVARNAIQMVVQRKSWRSVA